MLKLLTVLTHAIFPRPMCVLQGTFAWESPLRSNSRYCSKFETSRSMLSNLLAISWNSSLDSVNASVKCKQGETSFQWSPKFWKHCICFNTSTFVVKWSTIARYGSCWREKESESIFAQRGGWDEGLSELSNQQHSRSTQASKTTVTEKLCRGLRAVTLTVHKIVGVVRMREGMLIKYNVKGNKEGNKLDYEV